MGIRHFFSSGSRIQKSFESGAVATESSAKPNATSKNNIVSIVEHQFKRMNEAHDRIRTSLLASHLPNSK